MFKAPTNLIPLFIELIDAYKLQSNNKQLTLVWESSCIFYFFGFNLIISTVPRNKSILYYEFWVKLELLDQP